MNRSVKLLLAPALVGLAIARAAAAQVPVVETLDCFDHTVSLESVCAPIEAYAPMWLECKRQTLHIGAATRDLIGTDRSMHASEWMCSPDGNALLILFENGGNCNACEKLRAYDKRGQPTNTPRGLRPKFKNIDAWRP